MAIGADSFVRWRRLALGAAAAGYLESIAISALIVGFPDLRPLLVTVAAVLTATKLLLCALAAASVVAGLWMARRATDGRVHVSGGNTS